MQPKQAVRIAYIALVASVCTLPLIGSFFGWGSQSTENRTMLTLPKLLETTEDTTRIDTRYTAKLGDYYAEHFGFRQELVTADAWLNETLFGRSVNDKTTVGRDGWYYLNETLGDYTGEAALSERGIYRLQKTIALMNGYAEDNNITMLFFAAPNKNSIYPEHMPRHIRRSSQPTNLDRLNRVMGGRSYYLDIKSELLSLRESQPRDIYLRHDSHWNNLGALAAYNAIQRSLNAHIAQYDYLPVTVEEADITETRVAGDLTNTLYPSLEKTDVQYDLGIAQNFAADRPLTDLKAEINTTCQGRYYSAICYRDSFFNALIGVMSNAFAKVRYTRAFPYDMTAARSGGCQIAVVEIAERHLPLLLEKAPIMEAVQTRLPGKRGYANAEQPCSFADNGEFLLFSGRLGDWAPLRDNSDIYIELRGVGSGKSYVYEAFPICEGRASTDDGFSVRIGKYSLPNDEYDIYLHVGDSNGTVYAKLILEP